MNLAVVNEAVTEMNGVEHQFTEEEKNFVVQFSNHHHSPTSRTGTIRTTR